MTTKKIYYSMGEVAEMFDVTPALIRHWESQFDCIKPHRNKKGNRLFTPEDVERLKQIYHLVKERGMTLKGANKVLKRAKSDSVAQEMELLERLQKIRAALVEVREELKAGDGEQVVEENYPQEEAQSEPAPKVEEPAVEAVKPAETPIEEPAVGAEQTERTEQTAAEQPKKRVVRRRKKSDEEDKELFPFYEQSLF
ncbi:MAG: MerR family transcriptional regulator [Alistipes sp.]|nr:MerR family transcriptional regulator [Alistipes sp.]